MRAAAMLLAVGGRWTVLTLLLGGQMADEST